MGVELTQDQAYARRVAAARRQVNRPNQDVFRRRVDEASESVTYLGYSFPELEEVDDGWIIERITEGATITEIEYGVGTWTDRASVTYI